MQWREALEGDDPMNIAIKMADGVELTESDGWYLNTAARCALHGYEGMLEMQCSHSIVDHHGSG